jgi:hypothetical protein
MYNQRIKFNLNHGLECTTREQMIIKLNLSRVKIVYCRNYVNNNNNNHHHHHYNHNRHHRRRIVYKNLLSNNKIVPLNFFIYYI